MIKRLFGYIIAAAIVAVLVYTVLGRNGYTSFRPHAGNSENVVENSGGNTGPQQIEVPVQTEENAPATGETAGPLTQDSLHSPEKPTADSLLSGEVGPESAN